MRGAFAIAALLACASASAQEQPYPQPQPYGQPYPYSYYGPPAPPPPPPAPRAQKRVAVDLSAAWARDWIFGVPLDLWAFEVAPGVAWEKPESAFDLTFGMGYARGSSEHGLPTTRTSFRPGVRWRFSRFGVGVGMKFAYYTLDRTTNSGSISGMDLAPEVKLSFEPIVFEEHGVMLEAGGHTNGVHSGISLGVGLRI